MSGVLPTSKKYKFFIVYVKHQITFSKLLPSNGQELAILFYNIRKDNIINENAILTIHECFIYWEKARISKH